MKTREVLVALNVALEYARQELNGVLSAFEGHVEWHVRTVNPGDYHSAAAMRRELARPTDALITDLSWTHPSIYAALVATRKPLVCIDPSAQAIRDRARNVRFVRSDGAEIGRLAAETLLADRRYRSFAFVGARGQHNWSELRGAAYARRLAESGLPCLRFEAPAYDLASHDELLRFLKRLPAPAAVFAANDERAAEVIDICNRARLAVPNRLAVLGVDNDELVCNHTSPRLSSIEPDFFGEGRAAAEILMRFAKPASSEATCPARRTVLRDSTTGSTPSRALVNRVLAFIEQNACRRMNVDDIARHFKVSRRLLDLRFRESGGGTVQQTITARRLEEAKRLLASTGMPIAQIVEDCGYESPNHFKSVFRRATGMSMRDFRKAAVRTLEPSATTRRPPTRK